MLVVFLMLSCSFFMSFGLGRDWSLKRLILGIFGLGVQFQCRLFLFGPGIDIWRSCRFIGAMMRSFCMLLGGLGRFVPCSIGVNHCRLRHVGWERCSRGLTSRPQESASGPFLDQFLLLFHYPPRSSGALLAGTLPPRYCSAKFASRAPFWALRVPGHVAGLITVEVQAAQVGEAEVVRHGVHFAGISGSGRKRFRLNRNSQPTSWDTLCMLVHVCGRGCIFLGSLVSLVLIA